MDDILKELTQSIDNNNLELQVRALIQLLQQSTGLESAYFTRIDVDKGVQHIVYSINTGQLQLNEGLSVNWDDTQGEITSGHLTTTLIPASSTASR